MNHEGLRTWIEIDKKAIQHNYEVFRGLIAPDTKFCGVVKSNAYGHGFYEYARELAVLGIDWFAVDSITEGLRLRKEGVTQPILILGYTLPERMQEAVDHDISFSVSNFESLEAVEKISGAKIHIKLDTGMSRQGFLEKDQEKLFEKLGEGDFIIEGVYTHFGAAKNPVFPADTKRQINRFMLWRQLFEEKEYHPLFHASATSGTLLYSEAHFDMVRIGIGLYGLWPSVETEYALKEKITLQPVLSWKTVISEVKEVPQGERVGYDFTETLEKDSVLALCPVGYWHGFSRRLSGIGRVYVNGKKVRVIGRVSMDIIILDVTDVPEISVGDEVELIGENVPVAGMATLDDTSYYETLTRINPLIKRLY